MGPNISKAPYGYGAIGWSNFFLNAHCHSLAYVPLYKLYIVTIWPLVHRVQGKNTMALDPKGARENSYGHRDIGSPPYYYGGHPNVSIEPWGSLFSMERSYNCEVELNDIG